MIRPEGGLSAPLRGREFRLLFAGQVISNIGDWLDFLALVTLIVFVWHHGASALATLAVVLAVPWIVVAPVAGVVADRVPKRAVMVACDLTRAAIVIGLVAAPNLVWLLILAGLKATASTVFTPAQQATLRAVVPVDQLHAANALSQLALQSTKVIGSALGGVVLAVASPRVAFAADAATFVLSASILCQLRPLDSSTGSNQPGRRFWRDLEAGWRYAVGRRALVVAIASMSAATFLLLAFDTLSPLAFRELGAGRALYGFAVAALGAGGVLGAVVVGRRGRALNPFVLLGGAKVAIGALVAVVGAFLLAHWRPAPVVLVPILLLVGVAAAGLLVAAPTIVQRETPPSLMGRVSAGANAVPTVFQILAPVAGAAAAAWQSVGFVFAAAGVGLAALGVVVLLLRPPVGVGVPADANSA